MEDPAQEDLKRSSSAERRKFVLEPGKARNVEIARWSAALIECRSRTLRSIARITQTELDWEPSPGTNTIGTLLYHIALIEANWLYTEILERQSPEEFPEELRRQTCY